MSGALDESEDTMTRKYWKLGALAMSCVAVGAGASLIANAGAATRAAATGAKHAGVAKRGGRGPRRLAERAVQGDVVVAVKGKFVNVTFARGVVRSVSGQELTIAEGTEKATYRTVTLTIPTTARVRADHGKATLSELTAGQRVTVIEAPQRTWVIARG